MRPPEYLLFQGDARRVPLADKSVHACVTSPPYFQLRDYGIRGQIGLEDSPAAYVAALVKAFAEVHRVLHDTGTLWINIASSYAGSWGNQGRKAGRGTQRPINGPMFQNLEPYPDRGSCTGKIPEGSGLKPKDLIPTPWMLGLALQSWGWYLRSDCVWEKRNAMPSSVTDRPSLSHEYVFLLTKKPRYFYDPIAVAEPAAREPHARKGIGSPDIMDAAMTSSISSQFHPDNQDRVWGSEGTRNCRSVWTCNTANFPGSHFAVMAPEIAERCIKAGTSEAGCCPRCSAPYRRVVEKESRQERQSWRGAGRGNGCPAGGGHEGRTGMWTAESKTLGWTPGCRCDAGDPVPCRVFDPFGGACTTALVAVGLKRDGICCDLSAKYLLMGQRRIERPHAPVQRHGRPEKPMPLFDDDES